MSNLLVNNITPYNGSTLYLNGITIVDGVLSATTYENLPNSGGGGGLIEVTYSDFTNLIENSLLTGGTYYLITDFRTCYDVPSYNVDGSRKATETILYQEGPVEPILVLATSVNTISKEAFQPAYPNDKIQYDWTWQTTEVTSGQTYGRITERIDEYNNRTDYDHRTINFIRFQSYDRGNRLSGFITSFNCLTGLIEGVDTKFTTEVSAGDVLLLYVDANSFVGVKVISATTDTQLVVLVDETFNAYDFTNYQVPYFTSVTTNSYNDYKEVYIGQFQEAQYVSYFTFSLTGSTMNNFIGDYSNAFFNRELSNSGFLLANNVFTNEDGLIYSNTIGDRSYNNTISESFNRNTITGRFYNNKIIGEFFTRNNIFKRFSNNLIKHEFTQNTFLGDFYSNQIYGFFDENTFGYDNSDNIIFSEFQGNQIGDGFNNNVIGNEVNIGQFSFYNNVIGNGFDQNTIRQNFRNNKIGHQIYNNIINGEFDGNIIGNDFNENQNIGYGFNGNSIGNNFSVNSMIGDNFQNNTIGNDFYNNSISFDFKKNEIGVEFNNNTLGNIQNFTWGNTDIENLSGRTYDTFIEAVDNSVDNLILGKEFIMYDTVNNEYHKVKFTEWATDGNGGGFSYERTKVYPTIENTVYFTKLNYEAKKDIIVEGSLEITRGDSGAIYNEAVEGGWNGSGPTNTTWNSIYTEEETGSDFEDNKIGSTFVDNTIKKIFQDNVINNYFQSNTVNKAFYLNKIYNDCKGNLFNSEFYQNTTNYGFAGNEITGSCYNNVFGVLFLSNDLASSNNNIFGDYSTNNQIAKNFNYNIISPDFYNNIVGGGFKYNNLKTPIASFDFTTYYGNVIDINYTYNGNSSVDGTYDGLSGATIGYGVEATFQVTVSSNVVSEVVIQDQGKFYEVGDTILLLGSLIGGVDGVDDVLISVSEISEIPSVYESYNCDIFEIKGGAKRLSYFDENNVLTVETLHPTVTVISQYLTFPISYVSLGIECDNNRITTVLGNQTVNSLTDLVTLFNNDGNFNTYGTYFDNGAGRLGLYMPLSYKKEFCRNDSLTLEVFSD